MTLSQKFEQELTQLGAGGGHVIAVADGDRKLNCELEQRDSLAVTFKSLRLATTELAGADKDELERLSTALSGRLTYLMEPIRPIELDADACVLQMRSSPPQRDDDGSSYFELVVRRGGELALARYRKQPGTQREAIPAHVTREVLLRLVGDFEAVLG